MTQPTAERLRELMERLRRNQEELEIVRRLRARSESTRKEYSTFTKARYHVDLLNEWINAINHDSLV